MLVVPLAFALPVWVQWVLFEVPAGTIVGAGAHLKVLIATVALGLYAFLPKATFPLRLAACDLAVIALIGVHCASDFRANGVSWLPVLKAYGEWYAPYMAGRLAVQSVEDWRRLWPWVAGVGAFLGCTATFEALTGTNPFELLYGLRPLENTPRESLRWGIRRAYGPCLNPIYFGVLQLLLLGWTLFAARQALRHQASQYWFLAPIPSLLGIAATGSRGPILGLGIVAVVGLFIYARKSRLPIFALAALACLLALANRERLLSALERWSGESERMSQKSVVIDDKVEKFSGTRSRILMLEVYKIAFKRSGLLGYGTQATTGFPVRVPLGPRDLETLQRVRYVDNSYALLMLRFGYLGVAAFIASCLLGVGQVAWLSEYYRDEETGALALALACTITASLVVMFTVWMPPDFSFPLLWTLGITSGLTVAHHSGEL